MKQLTPTQIHDIITTLEGSSGCYDHQLCETYELDTWELHDIAGDNGVERCSVCGWWVSMDEIGVLDDESDIACEDCRNE